MKRVPRQSAPAAVADVAVAVDAAATAAVAGAAVIAATVAIAGSKHSESECAAPRRDRGASLLLRESQTLSLRQSAIPAILTSGRCNRPTKLESGQRSRGARRKSTSRWPTYANVCSSVYYLRRALSETIRPVTCLKQ